MPCTRPARLLAFLLGCSLCATAQAQVTWTKGDYLFGRRGHAMAYDAGSQRVVLFGGNVTIVGNAFSGQGADTLLWDGRSWTRAAPATSPAEREGHAMAYDLARGRVVMFGGWVRGTGIGDETWEWNGTDWTQRQPMSRPSPRWFHQMAYDSARGRVVLYGGNAAGGSVYLADTWEWDGNDWILRQASSPPGPRAEYALAYDPARGRTVLYGGRDRTTNRSETWEWNGTAWTQAFPQVDPGPLNFASMAHDPALGRLVLFGGHSPTAVVDDTWTWDGTNWTRLQPATSPPPRWTHAMAYDLARSRLVVHGGQGGCSQALLSDTWEWDGSSWILASPATHPPVAQSSSLTAVLAYDDVRRVAVHAGMVCGGIINGVSRGAFETWAWDGRSWTRAATSGPPLRNGHAVAFDRARGRLVLFGGRAPPNSNALLSDTWEWDGANWVQMLPPVRPPAREAHAMAYDSVRGRVVLFGGRDAVWLRQDTWEWDGSTWQQRPTSMSPPHRERHRMTFDVTRGVTVLFGGYGNSFLGDTWEYDGTNWLPQQPANSPSPRQSHGLAYDPVRGASVLFGGEGVSGPAGAFRGDTWEWNGAAWTQVSPLVSPPPASRFGMTYDAARAKIVLFGRGGLELWEYGSTDPAAFDPYGPGCPGSAGVPALRSVLGQLPWIGSTFAMELTDIPANAPTILLVGSSRSTWQGLTLPVDLAPFGMPGCRLLTSVDATLVVPAIGSSLTVPVPIPNRTPLVGTPFFAQFLVVDPPANPRGLSVSNAGAGLVGRR